VHAAITKEKKERIISSLKEKLDGSSVVFSVRFKNVDVSTAPTTQCIIWAQCLNVMVVAGRYPAKNSQRAARGHVHNGLQEHPDASGSQGLGPDRHGGEGLQGNLGDSALFLCEGCHRCYYAHRVVCVGRTVAFDAPGRELRRVSIRNAWSVDMPWLGPSALGWVLERPSAGSGTLAKAVAQVFSRCTCMGLVDSRPTSLFEQ
jgi:hypothetical protein